MSELYTIARGKLIYQYNYFTESKDDGAVEADSSEDEGDDWTFYRKGQDNKEESEMEATEVSILKSVCLSCVIAKVID